MQHALEHACAHRRRGETRESSHAGQNERLTHDQRATDEHRRRASRVQEDVEALRARYDRDLRQLRADREETLRRARAEAERIVRASRAQADVIREELRRIEREAREAGDRRQVARLRGELSEATRKMNLRPVMRQNQAVMPVKAPAGDW